METIAIIIYGGGCFAFGMYAQSKLNEWIEYKINNIKNKIKKS